MKTILLMSIAAAFFLTACNNNKAQTEQTEIKSVTDSATATAPAQAAEVTVNMPVNDTKQATIAEFSIAGILKNYLQLKNALVKDDAKGAASAAKMLLATLGNTSTASLDDKQKKEFNEIAGDAKEQAEHISDAPIDHQREHFAILSKDVNDLIELFGSPQALYKDICPMYNEGKGTIWISESKEIQNPYYGAGMLTCGSVKKIYQ